MLFKKLKEITLKIIKTLSEAITDVNQFFGSFFLMIILVL